MSQPFQHPQPASSAPKTGQSATAPAPGKKLVAVVGIVAIVLIGLNLRAGISSASALYHDLQLVLGYGPLTAALLPSIPTLSFAIAGAATSWLVRLVGVEKAIAIALATLTAGLALRAVPSVGMLLLGTVVSMSGLAVCNVAMPSFIREHYASRTAAMTGVYTITMSLGATTSAAVSVPLAMKLGSPSLGLAAWAILSVVTLLAFIPVALAAHRRPAQAPSPATSPWKLLKTRQGLLITAFFTIQAIAAYSIISWLPLILIDGGLDPATAGLMLGLAQVVTVVTNIGLLAIAARPGGLRLAFMLASGSYLLGAIALLVLPAQAAVGPALLLGFGFGVFALVLVVISKSGSTTAEATAMSTVAQSVGYLLGTLGPFGLGLAHTLSGGWTVPLMLLVAVAAVQVVLAWLLTATGPASASRDLGGRNTGAVTPVPLD
ncbi:CP family cyanate transporter-like MFS transporter [Arthrobacter stackebrandtii]|uniref:CP family cyanate transporter-like MFS transporter n=1 Tax=Arthrobacter stackebrandtii TaxID=272161 RepID=A0ABS4YWL3_9MICC|nr:MFS transporter [Arthrobacter stackebrandtii]MBP2413163.1 CP family cyanate transporter-like MFS transporter [Arthrobacter stackebrandtii]